MQDQKNRNLNYDRPVKIADDIFWVGFYDIDSGLHCNPYLIVDGDEAVIIDGGSRPDFPTVILKILQAGVSPHDISTLIYQHYDPDLCGSISNFEDMINRNDLKILSHKSNNTFIRYYSVTAPLLNIEDFDFTFEFSSGHKLEFTLTPYAHSPGSFITFDSKTGVLFTSDLFGSSSMEWDLFLSLSEECGTCTDYLHCPHGKSYCPLLDILTFHTKIMPSEKALRYAMKQIEKIPYSIIAPQHGSVINDPNDSKIVIDHLLSAKGIGIDGITARQKK